MCRPPPLSVQLPALQERIGFIDEEEQTPARGFRPVEELVELGDGVSTEWRHVSPGENGEIESGVVGEGSREERLARSGRAVEEEVAEGGLVRFGVGRGERHPLETFVEVRLEHDVPEGVGGGGPVGSHPERLLERGDGVPQDGGEGAAGRLTDQRGFAEARLDEPPRDGDGGARGVYPRGHRRQQRRVPELVRIVHVAGQPLPHQPPPVSDGLEHRIPLLHRVRPRLLQNQIVIHPLLPYPPLRLGAHLRHLRFHPQLGLVLRGFPPHGLLPPDHLFLFFELLLLHVFLGVQRVHLAFAL